MKSRYTRLLSVLLTAVLLVSQFSLSPSVMAASGSVQVTKVVSPSEITEGNEADIRLNVVGSPDVSVVKPNDIILIIDRSGSMAASYGPNNGEDKMKNAKNAAKGFIDLVDFSKHRVGVVDFASDKKSTGLSDNPTELKNYIDKITAGGGTGTRDAIALAQQLLKDHRADAQPAIVLMTDGQATEPSPDSHARQVALEQANSAKAEGVVFYTIALLLPSENPETSAPNLLMKDMATTAHHHHFVLGSVGLAEIYAAIVDEIGLASAYNVTVKDTVSPEFEIVPGSYQDNIPQPVVNGNNLTWTFNELKKDTLTFNYKIRHKSGSKVGVLPVGDKDISIKYDDYLGVEHNYNVPNPTISVKYAAPEITLVEKDQGDIKGNESVVITGKHFRPNLKVEFGGVPATFIQFIDSTKVIVTTPENTQGTVDVEVTNDDGQSATAKYKYFAIPVINNISPNEGPLSGNQEVTIDGQYFMDGAQVKFGQNTATVVSSTSTKIVVKTPSAAQKGAVSVEVENPDDTNAVKPDAYSYILGPELSSVSPSQGLTTGNEEVTLTGINFKPDAKVYFNSKEVPATYIDDKTISLHTPKWNTAEIVSVKVVNPDGQFSEVSQGYTYIWPAPQITSLNPDNGLVTGGNIVKINGANFLQGAKVYFDSKLVSSTVYSGEEIRVQAPSWANSDTIDVRIVNPDNQEATLKDGYNYVLPSEAQISSLTPNSGPQAGGTVVTIKGTGFLPGSKVYFDSKVVTISTFTTSEITVRTPSWDVAGKVDLKVVDAYGREAILEDAFEFIKPPAPEISAVTPNEDLTSGGSVITISGNNFSTAAKIYFDDVLLQSTIYSSNQIKSIVPKWQDVGKVDVKVVNPDGQVGILEKGFTYLAPPPPPAPEITTITPDKGLITGGTSVVINGLNFISGAKVKFKDKELTTTFVNSTQLKIKTPVWGTGETIDVSVVNPDGQVGTKVQAFTFEVPPPPPQPSITSLSPNEGELAGGLLITITGENFNQSSKVYFNDTLLQSTTYGGTQIKALSAKWTVGGFVDVKVVNPDGQSFVLTDGFMYLTPPPPPAPEITSIAPNEGEMAGGLIVTLSGTNFNTATKVYFNDKLLQSTTYGSTQIKALTPKWTSGGPVDVKVVNPDGGSNTLTEGFTYLAAPAPVVTKLSVNKGLTTGGTVVTVEGSNFVSGAKVKLKDKDVTTTYLASTQLRFTTPVWPIAETVDITVTNPDEQTTVLQQAFTFETPPPPPGPVIDSISPKEGLQAGGVTISIKGSNFSTGSKVYFNNTLLQSSTYGTTEIKAIAPAWSNAGAVTVKVVNPDSQYDELENGFTYILPPPPPGPEISGVSPSQGELAGGLIVTITGTGFNNAAKVYFNDTLAQSTTYSATMIKVIAPKWTTPGSVNIKVVNPDGGIEVKDQAFTYITPPAPTIVSLTPNKGLISGGTSVVISGTNFVSGAKVKLKDRELATTFISSTQLRIATPAWLSAEIVDLTVTNPDGQTATLAQAFTFEAPPPAPEPEIVNISPNEGQIAGGLVITLTGTNFEPGTKVYFNNTLLQSTTYSSTQIKALTAKWTSGGVVDVKVVNPSGQSFTMSSGFSYLTPPPPPAPAITGVTPNTGGLGGRAVITITGQNFDPTAKVYFNDTLLQSTRYSSTEIKALTAQWTTVGAVTLKIVNADGQTVVLDGGFTYN
ncbi:IPT/TIG domain-containing protein [Paenibacillus sp. ISL-20]|uniref:IPT/TIG domain-containing protein n=1 Tax=Paenibacillus sp. ISL-20 TaxID=2819163 RepID=UPI001BE8213C|nr:IPT/TIG domain-containing protein [Paenibacillus sp. ISL-20]MBT2764786.1 IPT/TIG domain-containing protein [Paenibacillus sp. ISL-20]